jgi:coenzyme F420 hydrogenase subunit beta
MRMGYAPLLEQLEPAIATGHKRIAVIGIPCQIYALRALENELDLDHLVVIGTPCSDNTTTENFHEFLSLLDDNPERINYLEFMPDFFPLTCRTCVDYVNTLSDITVGYMGGRGEQWLLVRNQKGQNALNSIRSELSLKAPSSGGKRHGAVKGFIENTRRATGGLPLRRMPQWLRPIVGKIMPLTGPKGLEFARTRLEMKAAESILHLRRAAPKRLRTMVPAHVWKLAEPYGLTPSEDER